MAVGERLALDGRRAVCFLGTPMSWVCDSSVSTSLPIVFGEVVPVLYARCPSGFDGHIDLRRSRMSLPPPHSEHLLLGFLGLQGVMLHG